MSTRVPTYSPCEREHNNPDYIYTRLFPSVVLAIAPAVTMDDATSMLVHGSRMHCAPKKSKQHFHKQTVLMTLLVLLLKMNDSFSFDSVNG